ncbi:MAG: hypothetical protein OXF66_03110 [Gammaproteobacteria bacterium]|nr:hypothetical protein [Gammaproteobacteria bacterium]MCY4166083.1 hypothetical protein [Gammaproteobacteria bacterium]MCY4340818.1 hypothetical protein [Gammaproteobacteria bacterium]
MSNAKESRLRRTSPELIAVLSLGLTILLAVLGQAVWLDGKIERVDARLAAQIERVDTKLTSKIDSVDAKLTAQIESVDARLSARIEGLHAGQAAIRERLVAIEALSGMAVSPTAGNKEPQDSAL